MYTLTISYKTATFLGNIDENTDSDLKIKLKTIQTSYHVVLNIRTKQWSDYRYSEGIAHLDLVMKKWSQS